MNFVHKNPAHQPAGAENNASKPHNAPADAETFSSLMRQTREQSAKGYDKPGYGKPREEKSQAQSHAREGKAKESAADHGKKNVKEAKNHAGEGKAKESAADHGKKNGKEAKNHAGEGKAKESAADHGKKNGKEAKNHAREGGAKESAAGHGKKSGKEGSAKASGADKEAPVDNATSEGQGWEWLEDFFKQSHDGMIKRIDTPGNTAAAQYRADVSNGKEKYVSLEDFIKQTTEAYMERAKKSY